MEMLCLGLNHRSAPVALREKFSVARARLACVGAELRALEDVDECVLLSTCNRMEVYFWSSNPKAAAQAILSYFLGHQQMEDSNIFYLYQDVAALKHLCRVVSGLDSMVVGETEVFGQVKEAYSIALEAGLTAARSNRVFQSVFRVGKEVRTKTRVGVGPTSVGSVAVELAEEILSSLVGARVLLIGAGEMSRITAQSLKSRGADSIVVMNRSYDRACELAESIGGCAVRLDDWIDYLGNIDIVIVSTSAPHFVITTDLMQEAQKVRSSRPLFLLDLSVPRNVDPLCDQVGGVYVYDIDTMSKLADEGRKSREGEIAAGEALIADWMRIHYEMFLTARAV